MNDSGDITRNRIYDFLESYQLSNFVKVLQNDPCIQYGLLLRTECVACLISLYNDASKCEYDTRCPCPEKTKAIKDRSPWFNGEILTMKREKCVNNINSGGRKLLGPRMNTGVIKISKIIMWEKAQYYRKIDETGSDMSKLIDYQRNWLVIPKRSYLMSRVIMIWFLFFSSSCYSF